MEESRGKGRGGEGRLGWRREQREGERRSRVVRVEESRGKGRGRMMSCGERKMRE